MIKLEFVIHVSRVDLYDELLVRIAESAAVGTDKDAVFGIYMVSCYHSHIGETFGIQAWAASEGLQFTVVPDGPTRQTDQPRSVFVSPVESAGNEELVEEFRQAALRALGTVVEVGTFPPTVEFPNLMEAIRLISWADAHGLEVRILPYNPQKTVRGPAKA